MSRIWRADWIDKLPWTRTRNEASRRCRLHWTESGWRATGLPTAHQRRGKGTRAKSGRRMVGDTRRKTGTDSFFLSPFFFILAGGGTHRLPARWQSWLACFVQKQQRPRQCRIRPYRNPHSLKPGPHPHSLQQSDTQPQPTALDTPGRGNRHASNCIHKQFVAFVWNREPHGQLLPNSDNTDSVKSNSTDTKYFTGSIWTLIPNVLSRGKTHQSGNNKQVRNNAKVICKYHLTQVWGEEEVCVWAGGVQAGCVCRRWGREGGVSLCWVMAESSRWCSSERIDVAHVVIKARYRVMDLSMHKKTKITEKEKKELITEGHCETMKMLGENGLQERRI